MAKELYTTQEAAARLGIDRDCVIARARRNFSRSSGRLLLTERQMCVLEGKEKIDDLLS
jgi:hypothetical protein